MSESHFDDYEHYNYDQEKYLHGRSGKQRTKKEASEHTNHHDPSGHVRKLVTKMVNTEHNSREAHQKVGQTKSSEGGGGRSKDSGSGSGSGGDRASSDDDSGAKADKGGKGRKADKS